MAEYPHALLGRTSAKWFCKVPVGTQLYINIYEDYHIGSLTHESREQAELTVSLGTIRPWYRIRIVKTKKCKAPRS